MTMIFVLLFPALGFTGAAMAVRHAVRIERARHREDYDLELQNLLEASAVSAE